MGVLDGRFDAWMNLRATECKDRAWYFEKQSSFDGKKRKRDGTQYFKPGDTLELKLDRTGPTGVLSLTVHDSVVAQIKGLPSDVALFPAVAITNKMCKCSFTLSAGECQDGRERGSSSLHRASGFKWRKIGATEPAQGRELKNHSLHMALYDKTEFTQQEWDAFGITDLSMDHFVKRGAYYFIPAETVVEAEERMRVLAEQASMTKIIQHLAIIAGKGQNQDGEERSAAQKGLEAELTRAKDGLVSPTVSALLTWHELFDKYAYLKGPYVERKLLAEGLALMVIDMLRLASLELNDDVVLHQVHAFSREMRDAGLETAGLSFEQFLVYAVANKEAFDPILQKMNLTQWSKKMSSVSTDDASRWSPSFHVKVWVSGGRGAGHGGGVRVDEVVRVDRKTSHQTLRGVLGISAAARAQWLSRCARVALDTISGIANADARAGLPDIMTRKSSVHKTPPPAGQTCTIRLEAGGGGMGSKCNGTYTEIGQHNGKPLYLQQGGTAKIYFNDFWKICQQGTTSSWIYGVDNEAGKGAFPPITWRTDGYSGSDASPCPSLTFEYLAVVEGAACKTFHAELTKCFSKVDAAASGAGSDLIKALDPNASQWLKNFRQMWVIICVCV